MAKIRSIVQNGSTYVDAIDLANAMKEDVRIYESDYRIPAHDKATAKIVISTWIKFLEGLNV